MKSLYVNEQDRIDNGMLSSQEEMVMALEQIIDWCGECKVGRSSNENALYLIRELAIHALATCFVQCEGCLHWMDGRDVQGGLCNSCEAHMHE